METTQPPQQNVFYFDYSSDDGRVCKIRFNSVFDSGNLKEVQAVTRDTYIIHTAPDCCGTKYEGFSKSWFYFGVQGVPTGAKLNFTLRKISILYSIFKSSPDSYKPVYRIGNSPWKRLEDKALVVENTEDKGLDVSFSFSFNQTEEDEVFFAFTYPFSCEENQRMLDNYDSVFKKDNDIYYNHEIIIRSPQDRPIDLLTISSHEGKLTETEAMIDENLFPNRETETRAKKFRANKPVILITARVHPGETPASHTFNGILKFLLDKRDIRAQLLRNYFVFMLVPILNPDGVANGHYRMDIYNQNLNRYYKNPDVKKQPAIFAIKELVRYLKNEDRLSFYCDLHAHAAKKGCFLYGNALEYVMQVETILFAKVLSLNCINFEFDSCNFSQKQMHSRDKGEKLTKEGAGRVCVYKICNLIHSYTMECGFHFSNELNRIAMPASTKGCYEGEVSDINSPMYQDPPAYYSIEVYEDLGKATLVSILDIFEKNPCTRIPDRTVLETLRSEIAARMIKIPRFWKEANVKRKCLKINEIIKEVFYDEFERKKAFSFVLPMKSPLTFKRAGTTVAYTPISISSSAKKPPMNYAVRSRDSQQSIMSDWNTVANGNENVNEGEGEEEDLKAFPKLKTAVVPREFKIKQSELKLENLEKISKEGSFLISSEKKQLVLGVRMNNKGAAIAAETSAISQIIQTPNKGTFAFKEGVHSFSQTTPIEASKHFKKNILHKEFKIIGGMIERKKPASTVRLPELERGTAEEQANMNNFFVVTGGKNYIGTKPKPKMMIENTIKKVK